MKIIPRGAFREEMISTEALDTDDFGEFAARKTRYEILWSQYQNDVYRNIHQWARTYKTRFALYQYIRNIYSPAYRLGTFWQTYLMGGALDPKAENEGALPIETENEALRPAIAQLWRWSNWHVRKDQLTLRGAVMGDAFLRVVDDVGANKIYLDLVHPGIVSNVLADDYGNVKAYEIIEERVDPRTDRPVVYRETATREGQNVVYRTYLNDALFSWNGIAAEWEEPYGFIPMVHLQHNDVGLGWGWSEFHPARSKIHEVDDLASLLGDQVRKAVLGSGFIIAGAKKPDGALTPSDYATRKATENLATGGYPELGREEVNTLYVSSPSVTVSPMALDLDVEGTLAHIQKILEELERDYPELKFDTLRASGDVSGKSLRIARQPAETKVKQRRANYDDALIRAQMMALSIMGLRGLAPGLDLNSFAAGDLEHNIGDREVFALDDEERWTSEQVFWLAAKTAGEAGLPLELYLRRAGWSEEELAELMANPEMVAKRELIESLAEGEDAESTREGDQERADDDR